MSAIKKIAIGRKLANIYNELSLPICRKYGVNQTCFDVLMFCANNPENNTARDICAVRGIKSGIASVAVETLISGEYMTRECDPHDRRIRRLVPTEKAAPLINEGRRMQQNFARTLRRGITAEELQAFESINAKLEENMRAFDTGVTSDD